jgi:hypothetical protein
MFQIIISFCPSMHDCLSVSTRRSSKKERWKRKSQQEQKNQKWQADIPELSCWKKLAAAITSGSEARQTTR